jgi:hypothetical protein
MVFHMKHSIRTSATPIYTAIVDGLACGEAEGSFLGACAYAMNRMNDGEKLSIIADQFTSLDVRFADYNHVLLLYFRSVMALVRNLMNTPDDDVTTLTNDLVEEQASFRFLHGNKLLLALLGWLKLFLLFHFGELEEAYEWLEKLHGEEMLGVQLYLNPFYFGLIYYQMARSYPERRRKFLSLARRRGLKKLRRVMDNPNAKPLWLLLKAEDAATSLSRSSQQVALIEGVFGKATAAASEGGFRHIAALSNERASLALETYGASESSSSHMKRAIELYVDWEAYAKAEYLEQELNATYSVEGEKATLAKGVTVSSVKVSLPTLEVEF